MKKKHLTGFPLGILVNNLRFCVRYKWQYVCTPLCHSLFISCNTIMLIIHFVKQQVKVDCPSDSARCSDALNCIKVDIVMFFLCWFAFALGTMTLGNKSRYFFLTISHDIHPSNSSNTTQYSNQYFYLFFNMNPLPLATSTIYYFLT